MANVDTALLALVLAVMANACWDLSRVVAWLSQRCADLLLHWFDALFAALVKGVGEANLHRLRYAADKMDLKARKMQRLVGVELRPCEVVEVGAALTSHNYVQGVKKKKGMMIEKEKRGRKGISKIDSWSDVAELTVVA